MIRSLFTDEQKNALLLPENGELDVRKEKDSWIISLPLNEKSILHSKVLRLIQSHQAHELIEGHFEKLLSSEELTAFSELRGQGKVVIIKTNPKFEKGIYRISAGEKGVQPPFSLPDTSTLQERAVDEYSLLGDGFQVLRTEGAAKAASFDLSERIKNGEVKGIKSFDGFYYLIESELLFKHSKRVVDSLKVNKKMDLSSIAGQLHLPLVLVRIVLEFSKEEGSIIEKQKNLFAYVG